MPRYINLVVAFDLDMTLIDSRPSVAASLRALATDRNREIDINSIVENLGPPIAALLAGSFTPAELDDAVDQYLDIYARVGIPLTQVLTGAREAVERVHDAGGHVAVITAKSPRTAEASLDYVGIHVDQVHAGRYGSGKRDAIARAGAQLYVGDTPSDIHAARDADAFALGVASGPFSGVELHDAGADDVIESLAQFPQFFSGWNAAPRR